MLNYKKLIEKNFENLIIISLNKCYVNNYKI